MKKLRLWLIKKLHATPNEEVFKCEQKPKVHEFEKHLAQISCRIPADKIEHTFLIDAIVNEMKYQLEPFVSYHFVKEFDGSQSVVANLTVAYGLRELEK